MLAAQDALGNWPTFLAQLKPCFKDISNATVKVGMN